MSIANAFAQSHAVSDTHGVRHKRAVRPDMRKRAEAVVLEARIASLDGRPIVVRLNASRTWRLHRRRMRSIHPIISRRCLM